MSLEIELKRENEKRDENRLVLEQLAGKVERNDNVWSEEDKAAYDAAVAIENETSTKIENIQRSLELKQRAYLNNQSSKPAATPVAAPSRISRSIGEEEQNILLQAHILTASGRGDMVTSKQRKVVSALGYNPNYTTISRSQSLGDNATGGYLAVNSVFEAIEKRVISYGGLKQAASVKSRPNGTPYHIIPADNTGREAIIVGENTDGTPEDVEFSAPINFKAIKFRSDIVPISNELLTDTNVDIKQFFVNELSESIFKGSEKKFLTGNGTTEPGGIITEADEGVTCASATAITLAEVKKLVESIDQHYRIGASFMMHEAVYSKLCELVYSDSRLVLGDWINGFVKQILGYPVLINNLMDPAITANKTPIIFGQLSKFEIGDVTVGGSPYQLKILNERYAEQDAVGMMMFYRTDSHLRNTWAVKKLKMAAS